MPGSPSRGTGQGEGGLHREAVLEERGSTSIVIAVWIGSKTKVVRVPLYSWIYFIIVQKLLKTWSPKCGVTGSSAFEFEFGNPIGEGFCFLIWHRYDEVFGIRFYFNFCTVMRAALAIIKIT